PRTALTWLRPATASLARLENLPPDETCPGDPGPAAGGLPAASSAHSCGSPADRPRASTCRDRRSSCARRR
ncbi:hypothetical protein AS28_09443, partial [Pygoscelis adeliae]